MNTPLVDSLVQAILALSPEERALLEEKLHLKTDWRETLKRIDEHRAAAYAERGGKPLDVPVEDIIYQMREERTEELMRACSPKSEEK